MRDLTQVRAELVAMGLNVRGVADGADYTRFLPGCRAVLVFGSGGRALWDAFVADLRLHPEHLAGERHPLDRFVARALEAADPDPGPERRWIRCAADEKQTVDFRVLALRAGLGHRSRLGLLLHPEYGAWMGLRAACFTTEALPVDGPLQSEGPCEGCPAPCETACPAQAIDQKGWNVGRCAAHQEGTEDCKRGCHSRLACPEGAAHAYEPLELRYHTDRIPGRAALAEALGHADPGAPDPGGWKRWARLAGSP